MNVDSADEDEMRGNEEGQCSRYLRILLTREGDKWKWISKRDYYPATAASPKGLHDEYCALSCSTIHLNDILCGNVIPDGVTQNVLL